MTIGNPHGPALKLIINCLVIVFAAISVTMGNIQVHAEDLWNPNPNNDDIIFPLPCDQKIVFRKIITHSTPEGGQVKLLDDRRIRLGSSSDQSSYVDYLRSEFISGHFTQGSDRFYLLGKYEVTKAQYKSLVDGTPCDFDEFEIGEAISRVSWYDAVNFGRKLTEHLLQKDGEQLEAALGTRKMYARLPTEPEWEFATRGGLAVSVAQFQALRFTPPLRDLRGYALFNTPQTQVTSADQVGVLAPNPLKLYDVYGNVAEMMQEPFRLNKAGRSHGMAGGMILRGGSFKSRDQYVNSAARIERSFFDSISGKEASFPDVGFRLSIAGLALPTSHDVSALMEEWRHSSASRLSSESNPLELVEKLRALSLDLQLNNDLTTIEQGLRLENSRIIEERQQQLSGMLLGAGKFIEKIRQRYSSSKNRRRLFKIGGFDTRDRDLILQQISDDETEIFDLSIIAHELIIRTTNLFNLEEISVQVGVLAGELRQRHLEQLAESVVLTDTMVKTSNASGQELTRRDVLKIGVADLRSP